MLLSTSSCLQLERKRRLTKDQNSFIKLLISIFYIFGIVLLYCGLEQFYKLNTFIIRQCKIKSFDLKSGRNNYFPRWNITIIDTNQTNDYIIIESSGTKSDKWAWIKAKKYKINETYPCYRSRNETSIIQWDWQWNEPTKLKTYTFLLFGFILFIIPTTIIIFKRRYQIEIQNTQQQQQQEYHQLKSLLKNKEQQQERIVSV